MLRKLIHRLAHQPDLDRYFGSDVGVCDAEVTLGRVRTCSFCRVRYHRQLLFEGLRPDGEQLRAERLWRVIRLSAGAPLPTVPNAAAPPSHRRLWTLTAFAVVGAVAFLIVTPSRRSPPVADPVARGGAGDASPKPAVYLYRSLAGQRAEPIQDSLRVDDGLLLAYTNPSPVWRYLLVFAVDEKKHIYWYYPAFETPGIDPSAIPIRSGVAGVELGEEIHHELSPGPLRVFAVFLPQARTVLQMEELVRRTLEAFPGSPTELRDLALAGAAVESQRLQVMP